MSATNSVQIEGRVGKHITHYPERNGKKEFLSFEIAHGDGWFMVQCYPPVIASAREQGLEPGKWVYVRGTLRATTAAGRCGQRHRFTNIVAAHVEVCEMGARRPQFDDEETLGEPPRVF